MPTVIGDNALEWKMKEMARRAGKKYEPEVVNPYQGLSKDELKAQKALLKDAMKVIKEIDK